MKGLKGWYLGVLIGLGLPFLSVSAQIIDSERLTMVPTRVVEPLQVLVSSTEEDDFFAGEIVSRRPLVADILQFTLLNEFDGVVWRENLELPPQAQRIMPFSFDSLEASKTLFLSVQAYDRFGNTAGSGHKYIDFPEKIASVTINSSEVLLNDKEEINVDLFVINGPVRQTYIPQIKIYRGLEHFGDLLETSEPPFVDLEPRQQQELNFVLPFAYPPGVYEVVTTLLDASTRQPISSAHYEQIYRSGYFFKVVDLESFYTTEDKSTARLKLDGLSTVVLTEPVRMNVRLQDQQNIYLDKNYSFTLQPGYFTKYIDLKLPDYVSELKGEATFYLQGVKIQTVSFSADEADVEIPVEFETVDNAIDLSSIPPLVPDPDTWYLSDKGILGVVIGCTILLLLLVIFTWAKSRWLAWGLVTLVGASASIPTIKALTVGRDVFPMVEWSNPSPTQKMVFNPSSDSGFQWLPVKGRVFNYLTQRALVRGENFESVRLNFMSPTNKQYQYFLEDQLLKSQTSVNLDSNSGDYFFVLDLQRLSEVPSIDSSSPIVWEEGTWQLQLVFPYQQKEEETIYLGTPLNDFGSFEIDQLPPIWQWQLKESTGEVLGEADFTNQPITVSISCQDQGSDCVSPLQSFSLVGNFCGDALRCNTQAARDFRVCDSTGNCRTDSLSIRGYDPVPPQLESLLIDNLEAAIATEKPVLSLRYSDPNRVDTQTLPLDFNLQMCDDKNPFFKLDDQGTRCIERQQPCVLTSEYNVWRGDALNGVCEPSCPDGYKYQNDTCQIICGEGAFEADRICLPFNLNINGV